MQDKQCFEVKLKFKDEFAHHVSHVGADNEHEAFMQASSNHFNKAIESYNAQAMGMTYKEFLNKIDSRRYD